MTAEVQEEERTKNVGAFVGNRDAAPENLVGGGVVNCLKPSLPGEKMLRAY